jgi:transposase InsO family protein
MTTRFRISEVDCIAISGESFILHRQTTDGVVLRRLDGSEGYLEFTSPDLIKLLARPDVAYHRGFFSSAQAARRLRNDQQYLTTLPPKVREKLLWKESYCQALKALEAEGKVVRTLRSIAKAMPLMMQIVNDQEEKRQLQHGQKPGGKEVKLRTRPGASTLRSWLRLYERNGQNALALLRKQRGGATYPQKFCAEAERLLAECTAGYLSRNRPSQLDIVEATRKRFDEVNQSRAFLGKAHLPTPSSRSICRRIKALDAFEVYAARYGLDAARRHFAIYENGIKATHPLERIEMDEWNVDIISLFGRAGTLDKLDRDQRRRYEIGRRWIYVGIDCATRCVVSFLLVDKPSAENAIRALGLITKDKTPIAREVQCKSPWHQHGGIGTIVTDQGSAFTSYEFRTAVTDLGSTYEAPPAGIPKLRGKIERIFGTFGGKLAQHLTGRTFQNPVARGDYPSEEWAALTDDELAKIFTTFIVDIYHNTPHRGLKGETPRNAWERLAAEKHVTAPPDATTQRAVFGVPVERELGPHGVRIHGINYTCPELKDALLRGSERRIPVRVDPDDISAVAVFTGGRFVSAQAVSEEVKGLSLDEWQRIVFDITNRHRRQAELTEDVIREARSRIIDVDHGARELMRIQPKRITPEELDRAENDIYLGHEVKPRQVQIEQSRVGSDLFSDVVDAVPPASAHDNPPEENQIISQKKPWVLRDD